MPKFRKKPVVIDAEFYGGVIEELSPRFAGQMCACEDGDHLPTRYHIHTREGPLGVGVGDWIICGLAGEFYACKPEIFAATYEQVD